MKAKGRQDTLTSSRHPHLPLWPPLEPAPSGVDDKRSVRKHLDYERREGRKDNRSEGPPRPDARWCRRDHLTTPGGRRTSLPRRETQAAPHSRTDAAHMEEAEAQQQHKHGALVTQ
ncbi:hypothetical protein O3P69_018035 [Scylla paramamosain]|uniref:Uncharacterized protein n=1 Tax=Scylla paramamosain TaxID=85552 RepID=A0AAW0TIZ6_SCYPA